MKLAGGASTQSRVRRPLLPGAVSALGVHRSGVHETVAFQMPCGTTHERRLLSWVIGQSGTLWGHDGRPEGITSRLNGAGSSYGNIEEKMLADQLQKIYAGRLTQDEMSARFFQSGGEACAAAARVARFVTGRDYIASQGYHGAQLDFAHSPATGGVPDSALALHRRFEWGNVEGMFAAAGNAAAVVVEVPALDDEGAIKSFLAECRKACDYLSIPLILDDVVGGFRFDLRGSLDRYGVKPDMVCLGKAMSACGGVAALIGRADMVNALADGCFYSTTFGGAPDDCYLAARTVEYLRLDATKVYDYLRVIGTALKDGLNEAFRAAGSTARVAGQAERSVLDFCGDEDTRRRFCSAMIERGILLDRPQFPTLLHTPEHVEETVAAAREVLSLVI